jgi:hypothetical protein
VFFSIRFRHGGIHSAGAKLAAGRVTIFKLGAIPTMFQTGNFRVYYKVNGKQVTIQGSGSLVRENSSRMLGKRKFRYVNFVSKDYGKFRYVNFATENFAT